jgi:hypothetical protein
VNRTGPPTKDKFLENVDEFVKDNPVLKVFFKDKKDFIQDLARKTADLEKDPNTSLCEKDVLPKLIKVSLHKQVIYCGKLPRVQAKCLQFPVCSTLTTS